MIEKVKHKTECMECIADDCRIERKGTLSGKALCWLKAASHIVGGFHLCYNRTCIYVCNIVSTYTSIRFQHQPRIDTIVQRNTNTNVSKTKIVNLSNSFAVKFSRLYQSVKNKLLWCTKQSNWNKELGAFLSVLFYLSIIINEIFCQKFTNSQLKIRQHKQKEKKLCKIVDLASNSDEGKYFFFARNVCSFLSSFFK